MTTSQPSGQWTPPQGTVSPEGRELAGYAGRLIAYIVDEVVVFVLAWAVALVIAVPLGIAIEMGTDLLAGGLAIVFVFALVAVEVGYFPLQWARSGQTVGMRLLGVQVIDERSGGSLTAGQAVLRWIGLLLGRLVLFVGWLWVFVDKRRRGWHDLIGKTLVVKA